MLEVLRKEDKPQPVSNDLGEFHFSALDGLRWRMQSHPRFWRPPMDVYETEAALVVRVEIAGMQENDFTITQKGRFLLVSGVRRDALERRAYHQMEIPFGEFLVELELPVRVDENQAQASYEQGFLMVILPKVRPHHIHIEEDK